MRSAHSGASHAKRPFGRDAVWRFAREAPCPRAPARAFRTRNAQRADCAGETRRRVAGEPARSLGNVVDPDPESATREHGESPARRPRRFLDRALLGVMVLALVGAIAVGVQLLRQQSQPEQGNDFAVQRLDVPPGEAPPGAEAAPVASAGQSQQLHDWTERVSERTDIPQRAVYAYARAEALLRQRSSGCNLSWATLAGIGRVESGHGHFNGSRINEDGTLTKPIFGPPLDGSPGVKEVRDTDDGALDGDRELDRAVGPLQFLPQTWQRWGARANEDGKRPDPQNVDDAALAAGRYLCSHGGDLTTGQGWWQAVLTYNRSVEYGQHVFSGADAYARVSAASS